MRQIRLIAEGIVGACVIALTIVLARWLRSWYRRWGATAEEANARWPGDLALPVVQSQQTLAVTVLAPSSQIWPWFVQLGCQRAGWYSYDLLDNGARPSAERILPEYQQLAVGDVVKAIPHGDFGFPVAEIEPERLLRLGGMVDTATNATIPPEAPLPAAWFSGNQSFLLQPIDPRTTRLLFRMQMAWSPGRFNQLIYGGVVEPISFVMGRKLLLNVKRRAEHLACQDHASEVSPPHD